MSTITKLTMTALLTAITTITSSLIYIPIGFAKIFPTGTGSVFAYPGSMIGAFLAAILYSKTKKIGLAATGEVIGTGLLGAMATYPIAVLFFGKEATLFGLIPAFTISSVTGAVMGYGLLKMLIRNRVLLPNEQKIR